MVLSITFLCVLVFHSYCEGGFFDNYRVENNACKSYKDYYLMEGNPHCYHNPDIYGQTDEIIKRHTDGVFETYEVVSRDGYIQTIFRIPPKKPNSAGIILLAPPFMSDSTIWVSQNNDSLAFKLWRRNYDIWLPNSRGTLYSQNHINFTCHDYNYWDFSFHEMALYDLRALIKFMKATTGKHTGYIYIGHSMGTTEFLVYASLLPEEALQTFSVSILMAPTAYFTYITPVMHTIAKMEPYLKRFTRSVEWGSVLSTRQSQFMHKIYKFPMKKLIVWGISMIFGWTPDQFDPELINLAISLLPRAASWKNIFHYFQLMTSRYFSMYNYGPQLNMKFYGTPKPPRYPLKNIRVPIKIIHSRHDALSRPRNTFLLYRVLNENAKTYKKSQIEGFNHLDFHFGRDRVRIIQKIVLDLVDYVSQL